MSESIFHHNECNGARSAGTDMAERGIRAIGILGGVGRQDQERGYEPVLG